MFFLCGHEYLAASKVLSDESLRLNVRISRSRHYELLDDRTLFLAEEPIPESRKRGQNPRVLLAAGCPAKQNRGRVLRELFDLVDT